MNRHPRRRRNTTETQQEMELRGAAKDPFGLMASGATARSPPRNKLHSGREGEETIMKPQLAPFRLIFEEAHSRRILRRPWA